jgi:hypothetical protein
VLWEQQQALGGSRSATHCKVCSLAAERALTPGAIAAAAIAATATACRLLAPSAQHARQSTCRWRCWRRA